MYIRLINVCKHKIHTFMLHKIKNLWMSFFTVITWIWIIITKTTNGDTPGADKITITMTSNTNSQILSNLRSYDLHMFPILSPSFVYLPVISLLQPMSL